MRLNFNDGLISITLSNKPFFLSVQGIIMRKKIIGKYDRLKDGVFNLIADLK
jgi:hypothetical protein